MTRGALLFALLVSGLACQSRTPEPLIGLAVHPSGVNGATLAAEDLRAKGLRVRLRTASGDDASSVGASAVALAESFVRAGVLAVIGHSSSSASLSAGNIVNRARIPMLIPNSTSPLLSGMGPWVFRLCGTDAQQGRLLAEHAWRSGYRRAGILYVLDDYGKGLAAAFARSFEQQGGHVALAVGYSWMSDRPDGDMGPALERLRAGALDVVLLAARTRDLLALRGSESLRKGSWPALLGGDVAYVPLDTGGVSAPFEGMVVTTFAVPRNAAAERFAGRYRVRFGSEPDNPSYGCYDAVGLIGEALAQGATTPADLQRFLRALGREQPAYEGVAGPLRFDARGDAQDASFSLARVTSGVLVPVRP